MHIARAHLEFTQRLNKVHTEGNPTFYDYEIDALLYKAELAIVSGFYLPKHEDNSGFETTQFATSALSNLVVTSPEVQGPLSATNVAPGRYEVNLGDLLYPIAFPVKVYIEAKKGNCRKKITWDLWQHDDVKNRINQPSWYYGRVHAKFSKSRTGTALPRFSSLYLDTLNVKEEVEYEVTKVFISYVKLPKMPWLGTYNLTTDLLSLTPSNKIYEAGVDAPVDLELPEIYQHQIIDLAVDFAVESLRKMTAPPSE